MTFKLRRIHIPLDDDLIARRARLEEQLNKAKEKLGDKHILHESHPPVNWGNRSKKDV
jgi:hypothetical protein